MKCKREGGSKETVPSKDVQTFWLMLLLIIEEREREMKKYCDLFCESGKSKRARTRMRTRKGGF